MALVTAGWGVGVEVAGVRSREIFFRKADQLSPKGNQGDHMGGLGSRKRARMHAHTHTHNSLGLISF